LWYEHFGVCCLAVGVPKAVRLQAFFERLAKAPAATNADDAYELLVRIMTAVEDEMSGVPADPTRWQTDGRLYPPLDDRRSEVPGHPEIRRFRSLKHITYIGPNGAIEVTTSKNDVVFRKAGADGKDVWQP
jgi:hypothetical protein